MSESKGVYIPRIILANEKDEAMIPPSVIIACALQQKGYRIKPFVVGIDEYLVALLHSLLGEPVTVLDTFLVDSPARLRELFVATADASSLNVLFASLGEPQDENIAIDQNLLTIAEQLDCPVIPIFISKGSSAFTARRVVRFSRDLPKSAYSLINAIAFTSVPNPREYQLLELSMGRDLPWTALGYVPSFILKERPKLTSFLDQAYGLQSLFPIKTAAARLAAMERQIDWGVIIAHAKCCPQFNVDVQKFATIGRPRRVGVIRHPALALGGDNNEKLLGACGFDVISLDFKDKMAYNDFDFVYVPHGIGYLFLKDIADNVSLVKALAASVFKGKLIVEGGSSPIFGKAFRFPSESAMSGLSFFSYEGHYEDYSNICYKVRIESAPSEGRAGRSFRGYRPSWYGLNIRDFDGVPLWMIRQEGAQAPTEDCWKTRGALILSVRAEFWSNPEATVELLNS